MSCPRCGTALREEHTFSGSSGLLRQSGESVTNMVSGFTCWNCGFWRDADVVPVMNSIPLTADEPKRDYGVEKTATYHIVVKFFDSITAQREKGVSWYAVAKLLTQAGHRCQEKTLQKHFLLEQGKRCGDGKAA